MRRNWIDGLQRGRMNLMLCACAFLFIAVTHGCDFEMDPMPPEEETDPIDNPDDRVPDGETPDGETPDGTPPEDLPPMATTVFGDVAFDPNGQYALAQVEGAGGRCLAVADLDTGVVKRRDDLCGLRWIEVGSVGVAYLLTGDGRNVVELALLDMAVLDTFELDDTYRVLDLAPNQQVVVASNRPVSTFDLAQYEWRTGELELVHVGVIELSGGAVHEQSFPFAIRSVAFSPEDGAVLVGVGQWKVTGQPETRIFWMNPETGLVEDEVQFANCAADLQVVPGGELLLTSPNVCFLHPVTLPPPPVVTEETDEWEEEWDEWEEEQEWNEWESDPTSVVDLVAREYVSTLPGFGPLAIAPDASVAVAFSRQDALMKQWNMFQQMPHGLIVIRLVDLYWQLLEHGDAEPDFAFAPGHSDEVLIHDRQGGPHRLLKMALDGEAVEEMDGGPASLDEVSFGESGGVLFSVTDSALRRLEVSDGVIETLGTDFTPDQVFARPQNDFVVVTDADGMLLHLLDAEDGTALDTIAM